MPASDQATIGADLEGRYTILEVLGYGSSATVYLAVDIRHQRRVALKVLAAEVGETLGIERFQREILTAARLQHPNILPLFDSGTAGGRLWYAMPFVESGSLRDRMAREGQMDLGQTVQLVREVADALTYAHGQGVVHRDVKPENIMLSAEGHARLADFGLARAIEDELGPSSTGAGIAVGTPLYMSPEQALGTERVDARADVYALATVAYELLAGATPFEGDNVRSVMTRRVVEDPPSARTRRPDLPRALDRVLLRALARDGSRRYPSAEAFARALAEAQTGGAEGRAGSRRGRFVVAAAAALAVAALGWWLLDPPVRHSAPPSLPVVAVLPFKNLGPADDQYFADGLTEEITSRLAGVPGLRVISRTSADQYRNSTKRLREIGAELGAAYVLEGSVRWERSPGGPGRLRVTPQLIRVSDDGHLWSGRYDADLVRVFDVQTGIAEKVTAALNVALGTSQLEAIAIGGTSDPDAYDYYLRGNDYLARGYGQTTLASARQLYEEAVKRDPRFALAFARLANAHIQTYWFGHDRTPARLALAKAAADSAAALAPDLAEAHLALGYYHYRGFRDYDRAMQHFEAARRLRPPSAELAAAIAAVERRRGNWDAAVAAFSEAVRFDPRSNIRLFDLGSTLNLVRRHAEAESALNRAIALAPDWPQPYAEKAQTYLAWRGDLAAGRAALLEAIGRAGLGQLGPSLASNDQTVSSLITSDRAFTPLIDALTLQQFTGDTIRYYFIKAEHAGFQGRGAAETAYADSLRRVLEVRLRGDPEAPYLLSWLGIAYALLGRGAEAVDLGERSAALLPISQDALAGPYVAAALARIYMLAGRPGRAIAILAGLLEIPSPITRASLRTDPLWAPIRRQPSFAALIDSGAVATPLRKP
jgi:TolB-like protein/Flp pilus assembly protein TadD